MPDWIVELVKISVTTLIGAAVSTAAFMWKERKESKKLASDIYHEALAVAATNRDAANDGVMMLYEIIQRIQASPHSKDFVEIRQSFQSAATCIAEPNAKAADEYYQELYKYDGEMPLTVAKVHLKKSKHFLNNNQSANRAMIKKLAMVEISLQLEQKR